MPFRYSNFTPAEKVTMFLYPALMLAVGISHTLAPANRLQSASFDYAKSVMPIKAWGALFIIAGLIEIAAFFTRKIKHMMVGLIFGMSISAVWALAFLLSIFKNQDAALTGPWIWTFIALAHIASLRSLHSRLS